jgi:catechol 2,3-dioxygenase-like lactoylglutathione lyase family enzyme
VPVTQLIRISSTVSELARTVAFYRDWLELHVGPVQKLKDPTCNSLLGLDRCTTAHTADVTIGQHVLELVAFDPPGQSYPDERKSNDQLFEHVALVTGDITAVWVRLKGGSPGTITEGSPVLLPPNTGSVTAFKFRDPEGHPLELIFFPKGVGDPQWQGNGAPGIVGYDHTAISVMNLDLSIAFYTELLGCRFGGRSLNAGFEQDRLDGLNNCQVDVVALLPAKVATPHLELLHYRTPPGQKIQAGVKANDVASARQVYKVDDLAALVEQLEAAGATFVSPDVVTLKDGCRAAAIHDPDGHMIVLME